MATVLHLQNKIVGQYISGEASYKLTSLASAASEDFDLPNIKTITGIKSIIILDGGDLEASDGADLTWSGNTLTIADGTGFDYSAMSTVYVTVFCTRSL